MKNIVINGKVYRMWQQFVHQKEKWVGGTLTDYGDSLDKQITPEYFPMKTKITDIKLEANGKNSAFFEITGKDFSCGSDVKELGILANGNFHGIIGHEWSISKF